MGLVCRRRCRVPSVRIPAVKERALIALGAEDAQELSGKRTGEAHRRLQDHDMSPAGPTSRCPLEYKAAVAVVTCLVAPHGTHFSHDGGQERGHNGFVFFVGACPFAISTKGLYSFLETSPEAPPIGLGKTWIGENEMTWADLQTSESMCLRGENGTRTPSTQKCLSISIIF